MMCTLEGPCIYSAAMFHVFALRSKPQIVFGYVVPIEAYISQCFFKTRFGPCTFPCLSSTLQVLPRHGAAMAEMPPAYVGLAVARGALPVPAGTDYENIYIYIYTDTYIYI